MSSNTEPDRAIPTNTSTHGNQVLGINHSICQNQKTQMYGVAKIANTLYHRMALHFLEIYTKHLPVCHFAEIFFRVSDISYFLQYYHSPNGTSSCTLRKKLVESLTHRDRNVNSKRVAIDTANLEERKSGLVASPIQQSIQE